MRIRVLGSGASDGWPNPWCSCPSCTAARAQDVLRTQSSVLLDDTVLIDLGPTTGRADLTAVRAVLVTHNHIHHFPQAWVWRGWVSAPGPLTVLAPPSVLASALLDPSVTAVEAVAGDEHDVAGYLVRVLEANHPGDAVLYDVTGPDGGRLLYATDTGVLPDATVAAVHGRAYDVVMLDLTGPPLDIHLDLGTWPAQVARLRDADAIGEATQVLATHVGHRNPPPDELDDRLRSLGARVVRDGDVVRTSGAGRRVLVLGGQSSGKSAYAESRVSGAVTYVATAPPRPDDPDWERRVKEHAQRRPAGWATLETSDVAGVLRESGGPVLVDDLGLWVTNVLDGHWDSPAGRDVFAEALDNLLDAWRTTRRDVVLVAPEVGAGVVPASASARLFVDLLGRATTALSGAADEVVQVVAGRPRRLA